MSMTKLEPKRFYWFAARLDRCLHRFSPLTQGEDVSLSQIVLQCESAQSIRDVLGRSGQMTSVRLVYVHSRISMLRINKNDAFAIRMSKKKTTCYRLCSLCYVLENTPK